MVISSGHWSFRAGDGFSQYLNSKRDKSEICTGRIYPIATGTDYENVVVPNAYRLNQFDWAERITYQKCIDIWWLMTSKQAALRQKCLQWRFSSAPKYSGKGQLKLYACSQLV